MKSFLKKSLFKSIGGWQLSYINVENLYSHLKTFDYISFDIFDTLIKRDVPSPTNVFDLVERLYLQETSEHLDNFVQIRHDAEIKARAFSTAKEITLHEIYQQLPYDEKIIIKLQKLEMRVEYMICKINTPVADVFMRLLNEGKNIYLVSDMYLPRAVIINILTKCGIKGYKNLYLSSEYGVRKRNGLFEIMIQNERIENQSIIHVGDDWKADVIPLIFKHKFLPYKIPHQMRRTRFLYDKSGFSLDKQIMDCFINNHLDTRGSYFKQIGYCIFGPLLFSFIKWVKNQAIAQSINKILFLARDGYALEKAWKILNSEQNCCQEYIVYLSRISILPIRLNGDYSIDNILKTIPWRQNTTVEMVLKRVDLYTKENIALAELYGIELNTPVKEEISKDTDLYKYLQEALKELPSIYAREVIHFERYIMQFVNEGDHIAVVDIGWNGTAQKAIALAFHNCEIHADLYGYYLGINKLSFGRETDINVKGYLVGENSPSIDRTYMKACMGFMEFFLTAPYGMTIGYQGMGEGIEPVFGNYEYISQNGSFHNEVTYIADMQEGAFCFLEQFSQSGIGELIELIPREAMIGLRQLCINPDWKDIKIWGDINYFENSLIPFAKPKPLMHYLRYISDFRKDFGDASWKIGFLRRLSHNFPAPYFQLFRLLLTIFHK